PRIDQADKIRPRRDAGEGILRVVVFLIEVIKKQSRRRSQFSASGKSHDADLIGIEVPVFCMSANETDSLQSIIHGIGLHVVTVTAKPVTQNDCVNAVVIKPGNEVSAFRTDI